MSNSIKKTKIAGFITSESEKAEKREANRKYRLTVKQNVKLGNDEFPKIRELSNVWRFSKDGKKYYPELGAKDLRK